MNGPIKPTGKYADDRAFTMETAHAVFVSELAPILGEGILADQVHAVIRPIVEELCAFIAHGIAGEIADQFAVKALVLGQGTDFGQHIWREAERIARTHMETGGSDQAQIPDEPK